MNVVGCSSPYACAAHTQSFCDPALVVPPASSSFSAAGLWTVDTITRTPGMLFDCDKPSLPLTCSIPSTTRKLGKKGK